MEQATIPEPIFEPNYLNMEFVFEKLYQFFKFLFDFFTNPETWSVLGTISILASIFFITIIIFSLVRIREIQLDDKAELEEAINEALQKERDKERKDNPRWHYILTLIESPNQSDWRVAIMEADSMLEELLRDRGVPGNTVAELLEMAKTNGYSRISDAWEAHVIRNQIAHQGSDFPLSKIEGRRVIKLYQNFFEEIEAI
ncbi:MAG: hypothetical protein PHT84_04265 [Candidatus Pacebacteria bacterium]|nr:hypothetical protein [Candidatus Paceibacterota bacterium]